MQKYTKKQIQEAIKYWKKQLNETSYEEGEAYREEMYLMGRSISNYVLKAWDKYIRSINKNSDRIVYQKGESYPFIEAICALAEYVKKMPNAKIIDKQMAEKFGQIGAAYMI